MLSQASANFIKGAVDQMERPTSSKEFAEQIDHILDHAKTINGRSELGDFSVLEYTLDRIDRKFAPVADEDKGNNRARDFVALEQYRNDKTQNRPDPSIR